MLVMLMSMASSSTFAQSEKYEDITVNPNMIWDNWFVSGGFGTSMFVGELDRKGSFGQRLAPAIDISAGKWFTPYIGARFQYSGPQLRGNTRSANQVFVDGDANSDGWYQQKWSYRYLHVDAMLNLSNLFKGYKEEHFYSLVPYAGAGWARAYKMKQDALAISLGVYNAFKVNSSFDLFLDIKGTVLGEDTFDCEAGGSYGCDGIMTATIGVTYKFHKRGWTRPTPQSVIDGYKSDAADLEKYKSQLADAEKKNAALQKQIAAVVPQETKVETEFKIPATLIQFELNSSNLSNGAKVNLENIAKVINKFTTEEKFLVVGYADKNTGSESHNDKLSKKRAKAVYNFLTNECGVSESKLIMRSKGGVDNMYYDDASLSRVVIVE